MSIGIEPEKERYQFIVEWYDKGADLTRRYQLFNYKIDNSVEMFDIKNQKLFLKRTVEKTFDLNLMFIGARVNIFSRLLTVVDYGDVFTRKRLEGQKEKTFAMIKPNSYLEIGQIIETIEQNGFIISKLKMARMTREDAQEFYSEHKTKVFYSQLVDFMSSDLIVGMELVADNAIQKWRQLLGPTDSKLAKQQAPSSIRARFGQDGTKNSCHGSDSVQSVNRELEFFFGVNSKLQSTAQLNNCTCVLIKPHILKAKKAGPVITHILQQGFEISAMQLYRINRLIADEFFEIYKDVMPEYNAMIEEVLNGDCLVLEVRQENVVEQFRQVAGPHDSQIAKTLRKNTIRAIYGKDNVQNAIHCTDLKQDGPLECAYFFDLLANLK